MYPDPQVIVRGKTGQGLPYEDWDTGATAAGVPQSTVVAQALEPLAVEGTGFHRTANDPWGSTLKGIAYGVGRVVVEPGLQIADGLQALNELGRSWVTGEVPRDINYLSGVGQMAGQGASTTQIVNSGFVSLMTAPDRIASAYQRGEYESMGEDIGALGVGAAAAATGARGAIPSVRMGVRLAAEDFAGSSFGQRFAGQVESYQYGIGSLSYAGEPGLKLPQSWTWGPNDGPQLPTWNGPKSYGNLADPLSVGSGKNFTQAQKANIYQQNRELNGGVLRSDLDGEVLVMPTKSLKGITPPTNSAQIDHVDPRKPADIKALPGTNSYSNAQILSGPQNRSKSNK